MDNGGCVFPHIWVHGKGKLFVWLSVWKREIKDCKARYSSRYSPVTFSATGRQPHLTRCLSLQFIAGTYPTPGGGVGLVGACSLTKCVLPRSYHHWLNPMIFCYWQLYVSPIILLARLIWKYDPEVAHIKLCIQWIKKSALVGKIANPSKEKLKTHLNISSSLTSRQAGLWQRMKNESVTLHEPCLSSRVTDREGHYITWSILFWNICWKILSGVRVFRFGLAMAPGNTLGKIIINNCTMNVQSGSYISYTVFRLQNNKEKYHCSYWCRQIHFHFLKFIQCNSAVTK